jgi:AraC-like DNA-binding protein
MTGHFQPKSSEEGIVDALSGHYLAHFLSGLPENVQALVQSTGLQPNTLSTDHRVPLDTVLSLIEAIDQRAEPGWHIRPALDMEAAHHGPLGIAMVSAPTVGRGLDVLLRFHAIRAPVLKLQTAHREKVWQVRLNDAPKSGTAWSTLMEIHWLALAGLIRRMLGPRSPALGISLPPGSEGRNEALRAGLHGAIDLSGKDFALVLPADALSWPCVLGDSRMHEDALASLRALEIRSQHDGRLEREIRQRILGQLAQPPSQQVMARKLGMSGRSLHRRLQSDGLSYRQIVSDVRASVALHRLRHSHESIAKIASDLGYQDAANFGRACRRWFGCAPGSVRNGGETCMPSTRIRQW